MTDQNKQAGSERLLQRLLGLADWLSSNLRKSEAADIQAAYAILTKPTAPDYRGYARLGTGQYVLNNSANDGEEPELIISLATEEEKAGRTVGEMRDNPPGRVIQPEEMCVRLRFASVAGLDALENQLRLMREECFSTAAPAVGAPVAWLTEDGERVVTEKTMAGARKDGGALLSSLKVYSVPAYSTQPAASVREQESEKAAREAVEEFKRRWMRVPPFADRVNKKTREAISEALSPIVNLPAVLDAQHLGREKDKP